MTPLRIGISANFLYPDSARPAYAKKTILLAEEMLLRWVAGAGALPYMIPRFENGGRGLTSRDIVHDLDGVIFSGGADISPKSYGEEAIKSQWEGDYDRDQYEIELFHMVRDAQKPILGVCRGHQLINVALGGTLYQDIQTQNKNAECHRDAELYDSLAHDISIVEGSILSSIYDNRTQGRINSVHHQAIKGLGEGLVIQANSIPDNIIESVWLTKENSYVLGVQWHPEWIRDPQFLEPDKLLEHFLGRCQEVELQETPKR